MSLIPLEEFSKLYEISTASVYTAKNTKNSALCKYIVMSGHAVYMDEKLYLKDRALRMDTFKYAQKLYYPAVYLVGSDLALARVCAKVSGRTVATWNTFLGKNLFLWANEELARYTIPDMVQEFLYIAGCLTVIGKKRGLIDYEEYLLDM